MNIFLVNGANEHAPGLCKNLSNAKDGSIIALSQGEMDLYNSNDFAVLHIGNESKNPDLHELDSAKKYIIVCDPREVNFEDLIRSRKHLELNLCIVRNKKWNR